MLSALDHPGKALGPYESHLEEMANAGARAVAPTKSVEEAASGLAQVFAGYGYEGDRLNYDDPRNADLIGVIERRRGLPVALGVLYIHAARAAGLIAQGLSAPGHFLLGITKAGKEAVLDPFNTALVERLRHPATPSLGPGIEGAVFEPVSDTDVLLRLQNNVKLRAAEGGDHMRAIEIANRMVIMAPKRSELWLELAQLNEVAGILRAAREAYEMCLSLSGPGESGHNEAALALASLKRRLN
jgi:regulator of sirC expression with transglutaminase-like and TPR domain